MKRTSEAAFETAIQAIGSAKQKCLARVVVVGHTEFQLAQR